MSTSRRNRRIVASTLVVERSRVLLVRQGRGGSRGKWNLPGGKVDPGETWQAGAIRETLEETSLRVTLDAVHGIYHYASRTGKPVCRVVYRATVTAGEPAVDGDEILDAGWFDLGTLLAMPARQLSRPALLKRMVSELPAEVREVARVA